VRDVAEVGVRVGGQVPAEPGQRLVAGGGGARGHRQQPPRQGGRGRRDLRRLLDDDVRVRAADAERAHPGPAGRAGAARPRDGRGGRAERRGREVDERVHGLRVQRGRHRLVLQREDRLDQAREPGRGDEVADVALHRPEQAPLPLPAGGVGAGEGGDLDRVAQAGAGAVRLHVGDGARVDPRGAQRPGDGRACPSSPGR
jgi:hypothetical protein